MLERLKNISNKSYSPYSNFKVAVILESEDGKTYEGVNVENVAFPDSMCAERVAIGVAVVAQANLSKITNVHIFGVSADFPLSPCGSCRQVLTEHLNLDTNILMYSNDGNKKVMKLKELIPLPILPTLLGNK